MSDDDSADVVDGSGDPQSTSASVESDQQPEDRGGDRGSSLRQKAVVGGTHLVVRQVVGLGLRSVGLLLLTRFIGPGSYGIYAGALAISSLVSSMCRLGTDVYLIRYVDDRVQDVEEQAFSFLLAACAVVVSSGIAIAAFVGSRTGIQGLDVMIVLFALIPVNVLWVPAQARLEREFRYRTFARIEFIGDVVLYAVAVPVAAAGAGVWAPVAGYAAWQTWLLAASYRSIHWFPRWRWEWSLLRSMLAYGASYSPSFWAQRLRDIVNPVVVGYYVGAVGVGQVALALRLTENLGFVRRAVNQVAVPTLSRVQHDRPRVERAQSEAMVIKILGVGGPMLAVTLLMPILLPIVVGEDWEEVSRIFPLLAVAALLGSPFTLHAKVLNVVGRNLIVALAQGLSVVVLALLAAVLVPAIGPDGFGWAAIGAFAPLMILDRAVRSVLTPRYGPALRWLIALIPPMLIPLIGSPAAVVLAVPTVVVFCLSASRAELRKVVRMVLGARARARTEARSPSTPPTDQ
ncbi:MAG: oligosaccharide flippase family protein [Acidimicrobiales bacterium]|nr:oligosaccharide flippase family protein [Acidimicrobiales bacterium]